MKKRVCSALLGFALSISMILPTFANEVDVVEIKGDEAVFENIDEADVEASEIVLDETSDVVTIGGADIDNDIDAIVVDEIYDEDVAGENNEVEPNDERAKANALVNGTKTIANLANVDDVDYFKYTTTKSGYTVFDFKPEGEVVSSKGWNISFRDADGDEIYGSYDNKEHSLSRIFGYPEGTDIYIRVQKPSYIGWGYVCPTGVDYSITPIETEDLAWEKEVNNTRSRATDITSGVKACGTLVEDNDIDYYKFTTSKSGNTVINFKIEDEEKEEWKSGYGFSISFEDSDGMQIYGDGNIKSNYVSRVFAYKPDTTFYVKIEKSYDYSTTPRPIDVKYSVTAVETEDLTWEQESNDTKSTANDLVNEEEKMASLLTGGDVDCFKYTAPASGSIVFDFKIKDEVHTAYTSGYGWDIIIKDAEGNKLDSCWTKVNTTFNAIDVNKGDVIYVDVQAANSGLSEFNNPKPIDTLYSITPNGPEAEVDIDDDDKDDSNNNIGNADVIKASEKIEDSLQENNDIDYYKLKSSVNGYVQFKFRIVDTSKNLGKGWKITILDSKGKTLSSASNIKSGWNSVRLNFKKGTTYYVCVQAQSEAAAPVGVKYTLEGTQKKASSWEVESNDSAAKATVLKTQLDGTLYNGTDVDYYKYTSNKNGTKKLKFDVRGNVKSGCKGWDVVVYEKSVKNSNIKKKAYKITKDKTISVKMKKGYTYYVKVTKNSAKGNNVDDIQYRLIMK